MSSILDFRGIYFCAAYLPANNLRRMSTIYLRGYWKGSENGRVVTIAMFTFCWGILHFELPVLLNSVSLDLKDVSAVFSLLFSFNDISKNEFVRPGRIHDRQNQLSQELDKSLYSFTVMFIQLMWCQKKQSSHWMVVPDGFINKGNNKITELRTILQRESQNS